MIRGILAATLVLLLVPGQAAAGDPSQRLTAYVHKVLEVIQDYDPEQEDPQERQRFKERLCRIAEKIFNFRVMARMSVGRYWHGFSKPQSEEYVALYTNLVQSTSFAMLLQHLSAIQSIAKKNIEVIEKKVFSARKAEVRTIITYQDKRIPVNYRFIAKQGPWKIYDIVSLDSFSLIRSYRDQFTDVLQKESSRVFLRFIEDKLRAKEVLCVDGSGSAG